MFCWNVKFWDMNWNFIELKTKFVFAENDPLVLKTVRHTWNVCPHIWPEMVQKSSLSLSLSLSLFLSDIFSHVQSYSSTWKGKLDCQKFCQKKKCSFFVPVYCNRRLIKMNLFSLTFLIQLWDKFLKFHKTIFYKYKPSCGSTSFILTIFIHFFFQIKEILFCLSQDIK